jgi:hypothetical protein
MKGFGVSKGVVDDFDLVRVRCDVVETELIDDTMDGVKGVFASERERWRDMVERATLIT